MGVGGGALLIHQLKTLRRTEWLSQRDSSCLTALTWHLVSSDLWTWTEALALLGSLACWGFQTGTISSALLVLRPSDSDWNGITSPPSWVSSLLNANLGLLSLHNSIYKALSLLSLFPLYVYMYKHTHTHTHTHAHTHSVGSISQENPNECRIYMTAELGQRGAGLGTALSALRQLLLGLADQSAPEKASISNSRRRRSSSHRMGLKHGLPSCISWSHARGFFVPA